MINNFVIKFNDFHVFFKILFQSVIVKSIERNAPNMYRARQILLGQECESCAVNANPSRGMNGTCLPVHGYNVGTVGKDHSIIAFWGCL